MSTHENYLDRVFLVSDPDARIRVSGNLSAYDKYGPGEPLPQGANIGDYKRIPKGKVSHISPGCAVPWWQQKATAA